MIQEERASGLLLVPKWPKMVQILIQPPVQFPKDRMTLFLTSELKEHHRLLVRGYLKDKGLSTTATTVIKKAWQSGTRRQYATYLQKWQCPCTARGFDPFHPSVEAGINFLVVLNDSNIGNSAFNRASALPSIVMLPDGSQFGTHPLVCRFIKGVFELKPSLPKYKSIWDVSSEYLNIRRLRC